jgi:hypothetical protein
MGITDFSAVGVDVAGRFLFVLVGEAEGYDKNNQPNKCRIRSTEPGTCFEVEP